MQVSYAGNESEAFKGVEKLFMMTQQLAIVLPEQYQAYVSFCHTTKILG